MIQQNIDDKKLAIELPNNKLYMLNDNTIDKLSKGLLDENANANATEIFGSDEELKTLTKTVSSIDLKVIEPEPSKDLKNGLQVNQDQQVVSSNILILLSLILIDMVSLMRLRQKTIMIIVYILLVS